uniref:SLC26A/SulP transporter domain-containing protein n=1 Tax=Phytophthora ramorum TaxID=164328 RepID=H3H6C1_PHYRM
MRTSFLDWEDKQLVQIAYEFEKEGIRITWAYVVRRMTKSKRTAAELRLRLASLKRTYGKFVKDFPRCFFGGSAPERCLLSSADARHVGSSGSVAVRRKVEPSGNAVVRRQMGAVTKRSAAVMKPSSSAVMEQLGGASDSSITPAMEQLICALEPSACAVVKRPGNALGTQSSMISVFDSAHDVLLCVPGILGGAFLLVVSQRYDNSFILSAAILVMPVVFFFIMLVGGISMDDARDGGWVDPAMDPATVTDLVNLFDFSQVHWNQLPKQFGTGIGLVILVALSAILDVAAIEIDMGSKVDINYELKTIGWSNVVSGLLGGYTGSYIFSQTVFTYRSKTNSRVVGVIVIIAEFAIVLAPVSVMSYVPRFFFAATLIFIAIDLMIEWLVLTYKKLSLREYAVLWMTFVAVNVVSLNLGIVIGIGIAILNFLLGYLGRQHIHTIIPTITTSSGGTTIPSSSSSSTTWPASRQLQQLTHRRQKL